MWVFTCDSCSVCGGSNYYICFDIGVVNKMNKHNEDEVTGSIGVLLFLVGIVFVLFYVLPLSGYVDANLNRGDLSTWELSVCGECNVQQDSFGRESVFIGDIRAESLHGWVSITDKDGAGVSLSDLLDGQSYCIYEKSFWWPAPKYYVVVANENTTILSH